MRDRIIACFEDLCGQFEDECGRQPLPGECDRLWRLAEELAMDRAIAHAENLADQERDA